MNGFLHLLLRAKAAGLIRRGETTTVEIAHDERCPGSRGGDCRCVPEFRLLAGGRVIELDDFGEVRIIGRVQ